VVGSIGEDGEQPRARAMLLVGSMGLEEHQGRRSMVAGVRRRWRLEWQQGVEVRRAERKGNVIAPWRGSYWDKDRAVWRMGYTWRWWLVGSADREVVSSRATVTHAGPASGHRLEMLHTIGRCMCGAWKSGGNWQLSAGMATRRWRSRSGCCLNARRARSV
jgi:hypothetical protein